MKSVNIERTPNTFLVPIAEAIAVHQIRSTDQTRPNLLGTFLEDPVCWATNGASILVATLPPEAHIGDLALNRSLRFDDKDKAVRNKGAVWLYGNTETGIIQVLGEQVEGEAVRFGVLEFELENHQPPAWQHIIPEPGPHKIEEATFDPDILAALHKAVKPLIVSKRTGVCLHQKHAGYPIRVEWPGAPQIVGAMSPMKF